MGPRLAGPQLLLGEMRKMSALCAVLAAFLSATEGPAAGRTGAGVVSARLVPPEIGSEEVERARIRYVLSGPASVELKLSRQATGVLVKSVCLPARRELRGMPPCRLFLPLRELVVTTRRSGTHSVTLSRLMSDGRPLRPGVYGVRVRTLVQARGVLLLLTVHR
jgi:hypothetical protein